MDSSRSALLPDFLRRDAVTADIRLDSRHDPAAIGRSEAPPRGAIGMKKTGAFAPRLRTSERSDLFEFGVDDVVCAGALAGPGACATVGRAAVAVAGMRLAAPGWACWVCAYTASPIF